MCSAVQPICVEAFTATTQDNTGNGLMKGFATCFVAPNTTFPDYFGYDMKVY